MSRFSRYGWRSAPKKPPPERGIRVQQVGTTWWGQRWIEALQSVLGGDPSRLARGRSYARGGRTHDLVVQAGKVTAKVTGSRARPYTISIQLGQLSATKWKQAIAGMAQKAQFSAELLAGQMPTAIDEVFREAGVSLFPQQRADLKTSCSCPDWGDPCKHVAATHYVLGEALDADPFLLFELRGKTKAQVLDALRVARGEAQETSAQPRGKAKLRSRSAEARGQSAPESAPDLRTVTLGKLKAGDYDKPRGPLPALHFSFAEPMVHGAVLRQLGAPAAWQVEASPTDLLAPLVRAAGQAARQVAMADAAEEQPPSQPAEAAPRLPEAAPKLVELAEAAPKLADAATKAGKGSRKPRKRAVKRSGGG